MDTSVDRYTRPPSPSPPAKPPPDLPPGQPKPPPDLPPGQPKDEGLVWHSDQRLPSERLNDELNRELDQIERDEKEIRAELAALHNRGSPPSQPSPPPSVVPLSGETKQALPQGGTPSEAKRSAEELVTLTATDAHGNHQRYQFPNRAAAEAAYGQQMIGLLSERAAERQRLRAEAKERGLSLALSQGGHRRLVYTEIMANGERREHHYPSLAAFSQAHPSLQNTVRNWLKKGRGFEDGGGGIQAGDFIMPAGGHGIVQLDPVQPVKREKPTKTELKQEPKFEFVPMDTSAPGLEAKGEEAPNANWGFARPKYNVVHHERVPILQQRPLNTDRRGAYAQRGAQVRAGLLQERRMVKSEPPAGSSTASEGAAIQLGPEEPPELEAQQFTVDQIRQQLAERTDPAKAGQRRREARETARAQFAAAAAKREQLLAKR